MTDLVPPVALPTPATAWGEFASAAPDLAEHGRRLFYRTDTAEALLATVRGDGLPRIHPIYVAILEDCLVAFITASAKATDLATDGRYVLHNHQDPAAPDEFQVRGRARPIEDGTTRARFAAAWYFDASEDYRLFEFLVEHALLGERGPDDWPPHYSSWKAADRRQAGVGRPAGRRLRR